MKTPTTSLLALAAAGVLIAAPGLAEPDPEALRAEALDWFEPIPANPPQLANNVATRARVDLGAMLFFDPRISRSGVFSCNSCHNVGMGGMDGLETSVGHGWQMGPRNSPTVFNAVFNIAQFWDGRAADLAEQAKGPVQAGVEMNNTPQRVVETLASMPGYIDAFAAAFPSEGGAISFDNMARAIEAFEATLITPNSRFDQFLMGDTAILDATELRGLQAFMDQGCVACHAGVNMGGQDYYPFGVVERPGASVLPRGDRGRFMVTETASDDYVFRAAPLRNIAITAPYFHSGTVWDLEEAVAIMGVSQLGAELSQQEVTDITAFLRTVTGEIPQVVYPQLPPSGPDTPRPEPM